ncbi:MAG TPA: FHA domain-containing protein [Thermoanaerobaculia bacterium]|nr:FHA domain-containing protein [Thermoanaerobaculia bacterium]
MTDDTVSTEAAKLFYFGEFTFDCASRQLLCAGTEQHLSPKAQHLLRLLLLARPRALSREELYDALWPSTYVSETNLAGIVNEVRRALSDDPRVPQYIRTVHGFGYAFCGDHLSVRPARGTAAILLCEGRLHPLHEGGNIVGRTLESDVVLTDRSVSRRHARITIHNGAIRVQDLGSKNGTFLNGKRIASAAIEPHDVVEFAGCTASLVGEKVSSTDSLKIDFSAVRRRIAKLGQGA